MANPGLIMAHYSQGRAQKYQGIRSSILSASDHYTKTLGYETSTLHKFVELTIKPFETSCVYFTD